MNIYEVIFAGTPEHLSNDWDTCFLVRAPDFQSAMGEVIVNRSQILRKINPKDLKPRVVYEIGIDLAVSGNQEPRILRGPYTQCAYNYCWKSWERKIKGSDYIDEWEEKAYGPNVS